MSTATIIKEITKAYERGFTTNEAVEAIEAFRATDKAGWPAELVEQLEDRIALIG